MKSEQKGELACCTLGRRRSGSGCGKSVSNSSIRYSHLRARTVHGIGKACFGNTFSLCMNMQSFHTYLLSVYMQ